MANPKVKILRSSVSGKRPGVDNIELGELALNTNDGHLFAKRDTGGVGIATTVALLTPWEENYEGGTVEYDGNATVTGISSAQSFKGDGSTLSGVVTSIIAGSNISVNQSSGQVTVTGLANTANVVADTLVVSGVATVSLVNATDLVVSGASTFTGIGTFESDLYVAGNLNVVGDIIYDEVNGRNLNISGVATVGVLSARDGVVSGTLTATSFSGNLTGDVTGNADTATALETPRTIALTGDVVATATPFDGTSNISIAATIQPDSVGLGTDTFGDYVESISGTANEIEITGGTGERSTPQIGLPDDVTIGDSLTVTNDASVGGALTVSNLTLSNAGVAVTAILDEDGLTSDRADALATQQSIKAYVDAQVTAQDLDFAGDSGTGAVDLDSQTFTVSGTTNEIVTSAGSQTLTIGMPDNVIVGGALTVTTDLTVSDSISVTNDATVSGAMTVTTDLTVSDSISVTNDASVGGALTVGGSDGIGITTNTITGPAEFIIDPAAVGDNTGLVRIKGDLRVDGEEFIVSSKTIELADFRVGIATTVGTNPLLDGAGIGIGSTGIIKTFTFNNSTNSLESSVGLAVTEGGAFKTGTHTVLDRTTLGASVVNSSLTSVGSLTQLRVAGVSTFVGIGTFESDLYVGGNLNVVGDIVYDEVTGRNLNITGVATVGVLSARDGVVSGTLTATSFVGPLTGNSDTATALETPRTIALTGDVVATPTPFDGTSNISIAATIQPDSVGLGTDTFGDYVESISGTANEIEITGGTGERSTPQIGLPDDVTIGDSLTVTNDASVGGALTVTGIGTFVSDLYVGGNLNVVGDIVYDEVTGRNLNITGVATVGVLSARDGVVSGTLTATNYVGDGSLMSGLVTSITAGANISIDQSAGNVTITGLANTAHIIADSLVVTGISTLGIITGAESIGVTTAYVTNIEGASATFSGNVTIGGTLTYEDVTNIDAIGLITARSGVEIGHPSIAATLTAAGGAVFVGVVTAPTFNGSLDGNAGTATSLETARNFSITGDFVTAPAISFDGTDNVAFAATVTADSIILGTYTSGDYVQSITGTTNEITVSATSGEGSTPQIGLPDDVTIGDSLTVTNDVVVSGGATVTKNAKFDANVTLGNESTDQIIINGTVASDFVPFDDNNRDLGADSYRWKVIYGNVLDLDKDILVGGASTFTGIGTFSSDLYVGGDLNVAGDLVFDEFTGRNINVTGVATVGVLSARDGVVSGTLTATSFVGPLTGNADTATALETPRTIALTGDVVATATPFDGTSNISIAATIQPDSVGLGTDTFGDYIESISGTANEITVTGGTGERSTPQIGLPDDVTIGDSLTITNDASVGGAITVTGQTNVGVLSARDAVLTGVVTATTFVGDLTGDVTGNVTGNADTATTLATPRTIALTGDVIATPTFFDGSQNISIAATIQPDSVGLGTDTFGDYIESISGTANEITVTGGTGERSTPQIGLPDDVTIGDSLTVTNDASVGGALTVTGIGTFTGDLNVGGNLNVVGDIVYDELSGTNINITGIATVGVLSARDGVVSGTLTATSFVGPLTGNADTATALETPRTIALTGDVVATPTFFDGTSNISIAATIQPDSVGLGTDTFGDYIESISGTANEIEVTGGTGERSTPQIGLPDDVTIGDSLTITNDASVGGAITVTGQTNVGVLSARDAVLTGVVTATGFVGNVTGDLTGNADTATALATPRTIALTGDVVATPTFFDGTQNISIAATIQPDSVGLGTDTFGDYVESISGTANEIEVTSGTGERSTPQIGLPDDVTIGDSLTITNDASVGGAITVTGQTNVGVLSARDAVLTGVVTATSFDGDLTGNVTGNADTATALATPRTIALTGDVVATPTFFDGTQNISIAATIQPDSVGLGTDTFGDYVESISGTANEIEVTSGTGERSTPQIGLPDDVTIGDSLTVTNDANVGGALTVGGSDGIGITTNTITGPAELIIDPAAVGDNTGLVRIKGDLRVDGEEFIVSSKTIELADQVVGIATTVATNGLLDGAGISIGAASIQKTFTFNNSTNSLESSIGLAVTSGGAFKTGTDTVLNNTTLGASVVNSSLTSVGTLVDLNVTGVTTASQFVGGGSQLTGIVTTIVAGSNISIDQGTGVVTITGLANTANVIADTINTGSLNVTGIGTVGVLSARDGVVSGTLTATSFVGPLTGNADTATALETPRTIALTGDVVATPTFFDGTSNISIAATIQPDSVGLGTDTFGDYIESISGTANEIEVTGGTGERSTPQIGLPDDVTIGDSLTVTNDASVGGAITVTGQTNVGVLSARDAVLTGVVTATGFVGSLTGDVTGNADTATTLATPRTIALTGDVVATPTFFDGSQNISIAATIQPDSVGLGTDTFGDYVESISGTANEIEVTSGTGERSTPQIGLPADVTISDSLTITNDASVGGAITVTGQTNVGIFSATDAVLTGVITATGFVGPLTGNADTATALETARTIALTGDVVATATPFDGTSNISIAATIQPDSVGLGTDTFGDYVESISGTANEIEVTSGTGERSTPQIGLPDDVTIGDSLTITNDASVGGALTVTGKTSIGILSATDAVVTGVVTATDFNSTSDIRLKTNIQNIEDPISKVIQIDGVSFNWKKDNKPSMGVIADTIQRVMPELVTDGDPKTVNYNGLIGLLIEVVKEQQTQINDLNERLSKLE